MPSSRGSSQPSDRTPISCIFCISGRFFTLSHQGSIALHIALYICTYMYMYMYILYIYIRTCTSITIHMYMYILYIYICTCTYIYYTYIVYLKLIGKVSEDYKYPKITTFHENSRTFLVCSWYLVFSLPG